MFNSSQIKRQLPFILLYFTLIACNLNTTTELSKPSLAKFSVRTVEVSRLIDKSNLKRLNPTDSKCLEEQMGDGYLGPSDYSTFCVLTATPKTIATFRQTLSPLHLPDDSAQYAAPRKAVNWWLSELEFKQLELFRPGLFTYRTNGWTGLSPQTGKVYIFGFTQ
jgi:hypothetical protein